MAMIRYCYCFSPPLLSMLTVSFHLQAEAADASITTKKPKKLSLREKFSRTLGRSSTASITTDGDRLLDEDGDVVPATLTITVS